MKDSSNSIGFAGLLALVFITLKLTGYIDWSWWWVLSPLWIGAALACIIGLLFLAVCLPLLGASGLLFVRKSQKPKTQKAKYD